MKFAKKLVLLVMAVLVLMGAVCAEMPKMLIPGGHTVGMKAYADGLLVSGVVEDSPAQKAGIRQGDVLKEIQGKPLKSADQLVCQMTDGEPISLKIERGPASCSVCVKPTLQGSEYRLGAFVRDHVAGIGTVSYYDPDSSTFGALGHGISDCGGNGILPISGGVLVPSSVCDVVKGVSGRAGQLKGEFQAQNTIGTIGKNTSCGVFGTVIVPKRAALPVAESCEIRPGSAQIMTNVRGDAVETFEIEIVKCYAERSSSGRNMLIKVTDPKLLEITGGIVQGMSGSPIIQDGKLVGAVTHVLVNDPTRGYGIFIENMLDAAG